MVALLAGPKTLAFSPARIEAGGIAVQLEQLVADRKGVLRSFPDALADAGGRGQSGKVIRTPHIVVVTTPV